MGIALRIVRSIGELRGLARDRFVNGLADRSTLAVDIPDLPVADRMRLERTLNRYQSRCGCGAGAAVFLATLIGGVVFAAVDAPSLLSLGFLARVALVVPSAFFAGLFAKLFAMAVTRREFAAACARLADELARLDRPASVAGG